MSNPTSYTDAALNYKNVHYNDFHQPYEVSLSEDESTDSNGDHITRHSHKMSRNRQEVTFDESQEINEEELNQTTILMTSFNVINSIIGSGIVGMPYALRKAGYGLGLLLMITVSIATDQSLKFIIQCGQLSNTETYQDMVKASLGHDAYIVLTIMQIMYPFIAMISYNVIIGDTLTKLAYRIVGERALDSVIGDRRFIIFLTSIFIGFPLSSIKQVSRLSKISVFSTLIVIGIIVAMMLRIQLYSSVTVSFFANSNVANWKIPQAIAVMAFAFMCQHNSFICFRSLRKRSMERWGIVVHLSVVFSFVCSVIFGIVGYITFQNNSQGDIFENYCFMDDIINVARFLFTIVIIFTYPVECFVVREVIETLLINKGKTMTPARHYLLTALIVILAMFASMTTNCLSIILELNGILTAAPMAFILPPLCLMRLKNEPIFRSKNTMALFILIFGSVIIVFGSITLIIDLVQGISCKHGENYNYCSILFKDIPISNLSRTHLSLH